MGGIDYVLNTYTVIWYMSQLPECIEALELQTVGGDSGRPICQVHLSTRSTTSEDPLVILMAHVSNSA